MPSFPLLKTGAVTQYPAQKSFAYSNYVARFLDGAEQRYRECGGPLSRWLIRLDLVDEAELMQMTTQMNAVLVDPLETTIVQDHRCMTTWVLRKRRSA